MEQRSPPVHGVGDVIQPGGRAGEVEVNEGYRQPGAEDDVARAVVTVADQLGHVAGALVAAPHGVVRGRPAQGRIVQLPDQARQRGEDILAGGFGRQRLPRHITGDERQDLPALLVDPERHRRTGEPGAVQVGQVGLHRCGEGPDRPPHGVPDTHDAGRDAVADQRFLVAGAVATVRCHR